MGIGSFNHHVEKGSKDGGDDGPGPEPIPLNSKLWCYFLFPLIIFMSFKSFVWERCQNSNSSAVCFLAPAYAKVRSYFCELLDGIILSACLVWGSLAIIWVILNYGKVKSMLPSLNRERYHVLWYVIKFLLVVYWQYMNVHCANSCDWTFVVILSVSHLRWRGSDFGINNLSFQKYVVAN